MWFEKKKGLANEFQESLKLAYHYLDITQVRHDVPDLKKYYRHISKGAWPFSTRDHGWPISGKKKRRRTNLFI
jgi:cycloartenol synthase